jgi:small ligand-binding sensory domain FIST
MSVRIGAALALGGAPTDAAADAARWSRDALGEPADVALVFAAGAHLLDPRATLAAVNDTLEPGALVGCGAGGVLGGRREIEAGTAIAIWAAALDGGAATPFHSFAIDADDDAIAVAGLPDLSGAAAALLLPDPASYPTDLILRELGHRAPGVPVLGGLSSGASPSGGPVLFCGEEAHVEGAVGLRLDGVDVLPCVSQGATPLGPELTVTTASGNVIEELAGRPALTTLRETIAALDAAERAALARGLLLGLVVDGGKPEYVQGDFLVRGLTGADPERGSVAVAAAVRPGQVVRLHARDAESADRDLREALALRRDALAGQEPAGALVFTCTGRGRGMFGHPDHDAEVVGDALDDVPTAGFFAAGEIGPVGPASFLHGFTATVAVFA